MKWELLKEFLQKLAQKAILKHLKQPPFHCPHACAVTLLSFLAAKATTIADALEPKPRGDR